jgi:hypothetical protein
VRRGTVRIKRGLIIVLLIQEKAAGLGGRTVDQVHPASRLGACGWGEQIEQLDRFVFVAFSDHVRDGDADQGYPLNHSSANYADNGNCVGYCTAMRATCEQRVQSRKQVISDKMGDLLLLMGLLLLLRHR